MHTTPLDQQLQERLTVIDTAVESDTTVADLPLRDFLLAVAVLVVAIVALTWETYSGPRRPAADCLPRGPRPWPTRR